MEWNADILDSGLNSYDNFIRRVKALGKKVGKINMAFKEEFKQAINDDLNMSKAIAVANEVFKSDIADEDKLATILDFDKVFGLNLEKLVNSSLITAKLPDKVGQLMTTRQAARVGKNWAESDRLRDEILELGYEIKDTPTGQQVTKK
jgi:cysteinyl-tRNA synthetase